MNYFIIVLLILAVNACTNGKNNIGDNIIYEDILSQLVLKSYLLPINGPPPVPPFIEEHNEMEELRNYIYGLENRISKVEEFIRTDHRILVLDKLLPAQYTNFKRFYSGSTSMSYDTTWIGNIDNRIKNGNDIGVKNMKLEIPNFKIDLVNNIPDPDTLIYQSKSKDKDDLFYLQLSEIILDRTKTRGIFYYSISTKGNLDGYMKYCYIIKEENDWQILDK